MFKMKNTIHAISLMPGHPDYMTMWVVGDNCESIQFRIWDALGKACYWPIVDGEAKALYWAEQIEKVYYTDMTVLSMEWTGKSIKGVLSKPPPPSSGYNCRCKTLPVDSRKCECGSVRVDFLYSGEIKCSLCGAILKGVKK